MGRIAIVDLSFTWPPDGGARTDVREIALRLQRRHEVRLFVPDLRGWIGTSTFWVKWPLDRTRFFWKGKISDDVGIPYTCVSFGPLSFGAASVGRLFMEAVEKWRPDHVWIADGWYLKPFVAAALEEFKPVMRIYAHEMLCLKGNGFFFRWGKPCHVDYLSGGPGVHARCLACTSAFYLSYPSPTWIHEFLTSGAFLPGYPDRVRDALGSVRTVVVYNKSTEERVRPFAKDVRVIPSGVDTSVFSPGASRPVENGEPKIILAMGRTEEPRKGISVLIEAGRILRRGRKDFEIWLTDRRPSRVPWIRHVGWVPFAQMPEIYRNASIAVAPSLWPEPLGIVALEAMACERPVVVSRIGGLGEVVRHGIDGFAFEPGNAEELARLLGLLLDDSDLRGKVGRAGRETVLQKYTWDRIVDEAIEPLFGNR